MCNDIFPSQREIAFRAGVTSKCVNASAQLAEKEGWIIRYEQKAHIRTMYPSRSVWSDNIFEKAILETAVQVPDCETR